MTSGNALSGATADDYLDTTIATIDWQKVAFNPVIAKLFNLNADGTAKEDGTSLRSVSWDPSHDAAQMAATFGVNTEVLITNDSASGAQAPAKALAVAGETSSKSRYMVMGSNPFRTATNGQMDQFMANAIHWLTGKSRGAAIKVAIVHLDESYWFKDESSTRTWLTTKLGSPVSYNVANAYDGTNLNKILTDGADLVIVSQQLDAGQDATQVRNGIKTLMDAGKPVLYIQLDGGLNDLGKQLFDLFQVQYVADNYWSKYRSTNLDGASMMGRIPQNMADIREMLVRLKSGSYSLPIINFNDSSATNPYKAEFQNGADAVRSMMQSYDANGVDIFTSSGREVPKLLALLGDRIRQDIVYPLSTAKSTHKNFFRAFYADNAVYNVRKVVPAQKDLGTFSRTDFSKVPLVTRSVSMVSRPNFRSTGAYALPGQTFTVTRSDVGAVKTWIVINTLRSGSTQMWSDNSFGGYARPKYLQSQWVPIKHGETIYLTSPYGGPVQIGFDVKDVPVQLTFKNVSEHPHWRGPQDDTSFAAKLAANTHDWVEVATDGFEMHSKADRFKTQTLANPNWSTPAKLAAATMRYTYHYTHIMAGFQGEGIDKEPEVFGWATSKGLSVATTNVVKHMNADVPTCGWGCSGNPYDAGWAFTPIGHGDIHELGHSLQSGRWQLKHGGISYPNHAGTNFYAYYVQSRFYDDTAEVPSVQQMPFKTLFQQLQAAYVAGDRSGTVSTVMENYFSNVLSGGGDSGISNSYAFFTQLMMQARSKGLLNNGWHMMARIHIVDRNFNEAIKSQTTWDAQKSAMGFSQMSWADAKTLSNNDFMAIAMSYVTGMDVRDYMAMWGFRISDVANTQIASFGLPVAERVFFALKDSQWAEGALSKKVATYIKIPINGTTAWPLN